jgi:hypothetical protein
MGRNEWERKAILLHPRSVKYKRARQKANSYQLIHTNGTGVEIPAGVRELRAEATLTFRHRDTGKTQTNVFTTTMLKRERTKLGPLE